MQYRLFVEVGNEGWVAAIRDNSLQKWHWKENVGSEEEGQALALSKLRDNLSAAEYAELEASDPRWESYGPNRKAPIGYVGNGVFMDLSYTIKKP